MKNEINFCINKKEIKQKAPLVITSWETVNIIDNINKKITIDLNNKEKLLYDMNDLVSQLFFNESNFISGKRKIQLNMKEYKNKTWFNVLVVLVIAIFIFIAARNMRAFITGLQNLLAA